MDMYSYILHTFRMQAKTVASWGFNLPVRFHDGIGVELFVEGLIHQGRVKVLYDAGADAFDIYIMNADGSYHLFDALGILWIMVSCADAHFLFGQLCLGLSAISCIHNILRRKGKANRECAKYRHPFCKSIP